MQPSTLPVPQRPTSLGPATTQILPIEYARLLFKEGRRRIVMLSLIFTAIAALTFLTGVFVVARSYEVSVTILAQDSDIITPLLEGRAVPTGVTDRAGMARQIVYSRKVLSEIIGVGGWDGGGNLSPLQEDRLMEEIQGRTLVASPRPDIVQISYRDTDPQRAYEVTDAMGSLFIEETLATKERESRQAYEFIDAQVQMYQRKLVEAENNLHEYRVRNEDAQPGSAVDANSRISALRTQVEQTRMAVLEQESREASITAQLSGESAVTTVQTREMLHRTRLIELQAELDRLLLTFTDRHPDVVRTRHQMEDAQRQLDQEQSRVASRSSSTRSDDSQLNPLYQELRSQLSQAQRDVAATRSRMVAAESLLSDELARSRRIAAQEGALAGLNREYDVNQEIYQDMLRRRENARVSMGLDQENRGLTLRVQDPPTIPLRPTGLRFMHIAAAGMLLAVAMPLGLLWLLVRFDPRVRSPQLIESKSRYPLLATIPAYPSPRERRRQYFDIGIGSVLVTGVLLLYLLTYIHKMSQG
ncbi:XrtA system polysaccharide chain length determinant [Luteimonas terricola]|uniref:Chain-length determining protein n=1 Tax=Luteimonas terricola TaxID=645597 RepID=A0ABQ2EEB1_9GAMM|nr:XrtA system polysaccharide chain length determinant [Luteimonas terricola]GGK08915.1 chain-length determining protein [Luteimonas terricola]